GPFDSRLVTLGGCRAAPIMSAQPGGYFGEDALAAVIHRDDVTRSLGPHQFLVARTEIPDRKLPHLGSDPRVLPGHDDQCRRRHPAECTSRLTHDPRKLEKHAPRHRSISEILLPLDWVVNRSRAPRIYFPRESTPESVHPGGESNPCRHSEIRRYKHHRFER